MRRSIFASILAVRPVDQSSANPLCLKLLIIQYVSQLPTRCQLLADRAQSPSPRLLRHHEHSLALAGLPVFDDIEAGCGHTRCQLSARENPQQRQQAECLSDRGDVPEEPHAIAET